MKQNVALGWVEKISLLHIAKAVLAFFIAFSAGKLLFFAYNIIRAPFQLELREGAILSTTQLLISGHNPFRPEYLPQYLNVYGVFYNWIAAPFALVFGNTFLVHRLLTGFCLLAAVLYLAWVTVQKGSSPLFAAAGGVCLTANLLYSVTPLTRPDGIGFLLYILACLLPWQRGFSKGSLAASAVLGTLAFFTKVYFTFAVIYVALYLFLQVSKRSAVFYGLFFALLLAGAATAIHFLYPYYFYETFFMAAARPVYVLSHTIFQVRQFITLYSGMLLLLIVAIDWQRLALLRIPSGKIRIPFTGINIRSLTKPLLLFSIDYPTFAFVIVTTAVIVKLGGHTGSKMVYLFHLMSPLFVIIFARLASRLPRYSLLSCLLAGITISMNLLQIGLNPIKPQILPSSLPNNPALFQKNWDQMGAIVRSNPRILNAPLIAGMLVEMNRPLVDNGHTEYFGVDPIPPNPLLPDMATIRGMYDHFRAGVYQGVETQSYDKVIVDKNFSPFIDFDTLQKTYRLEEEIDLYSVQNREDFHLQVWTPVKK